MNYIMLLLVNGDLTLHFLRKKLLLLSHHKDLYSFGIEKHSYPAILLSGLISSLLQMAPKAIRVSLSVKMC